jgi:hypothetical protein
MNFRIWRLIGISVGRGWMNNVDCAISIAIWHQPWRPLYEIPWWHRFKAAWNWLPPRTYVVARQAPSDGCIDSTAWTGRDIVLHEIHWREWKFFVDWF